ncbi:MAG TPA: serine hydrolase [Steroidobacteraceae bacterium]|jgi:CubicO group peptidase (beta-lactamase class C family)|nr:serine hydrolase [Steroidobacteraceae bacterium]
MHRPAALLTTLLACSAHAAGLPTDVEIHRILEDRVQAIAGPEGGMGIVVGVLDQKGPRVIAYGDDGSAARRALNGDSVFEIASVTKVFTALLLTDMVRKHELALTDPVTKYLPKGTKLPERNGRPITLVDLATHTSGLPFMPDGADPYRFLATYSLPRDVGAEWDYSNLGYWLLQEALAKRGRADFEQLLQKRVSAPLGLHSTTITWSPELKSRDAIGHDAALQPAPLFASMPVYNLMPAAGGMISTPNDLLKFLGIAMGYEESKLAPTVARQLQTRRPAGSSEQALGWLVTGAGDDAIVYHDGGSFGYASSVAWQPRRRIGVVVLANQTANVGDIARHLLQPSVPLEKPARARHTEITLDAATLDKYAGRYDMKEEGVVVIARDNSLLTIELPASWGLPKLRLHAESQRDFFATELPLRVTFEADGSAMQVFPPRGQRAISAVRL